MDRFHLSRWGIMGLQIPSPMQVYLKEAQVVIEGDARAYSQQWDPSYDTAKPRTVPHRSMFDFENCAKRTIGVGADSVQRHHTQRTTSKPSSLFDKSGPPVELDLAPQKPARTVGCTKSAAPDHIGKRTTWAWKKPDAHIGDTVNPSYR